MALHALLSFLFGIIFPDDLQSFIAPLTDVLNVVIVFAILAMITWSFIVLCIYGLFGLRLPWYPSLEDDTTENPKLLRFADTELIDLRATKQGEQLFVDGYKLGYHHGKTGVKALHREHSSWDDAAESAMTHLKQSFAHDEAEARRALRKAL